MFEFNVPVSWRMSAMLVAGISFVYGMLCLSGWWDTRHATTPGTMLAHQITAPLGALSFCVFAVFALFVLLTKASGDRPLDRQLPLFTTEHRPMAKHF